MTRPENVYVSFCEGVKHSGVPRFWKHTQMSIEFVGALDTGRSLKFERAMLGADLALMQSKHFNMPCMLIILYRYVHRHLHPSIFWSVCLIIHAFVCLSACLSG